MSWKRVVVVVVDKEFDVETMNPPENRKRKPKLGRQQVSIRTGAPLKC